MSTSTGQAIVAVLESDILTAAGQPLLTFLQNVKTNPDPLNEAAQWIQLTGALVGSLPGLEVTVIQQLATTLQTKLAALIAAKQASASTPGLTTA
jgi:hypothetical protein